MTGEVRLPGLRINVVSQLHASCPARGHSGRGKRAARGLAWPIRTTLCAGRVGQLLEQGEEIDGAAPIMCQNVTSLPCELRGWRGLPPSDLRLTHSLPRRLSTSCAAADRRLGEAVGSRNTDVRLVHRLVAPRPSRQSAVA